MSVSRSISSRKMAIEVYAYDVYKGVTNPMEKKRSALASREGCVSRKECLAKCYRFGRHKLYSNIYNTKNSV